MQLYYRDQLLGEITDYSGEGLWMNGTIGFSEKGEKLASFFAWMVDETHVGEDPPFSQDLLMPEHWYLINNNGEKLGIDIPAIHGDRHDISWRWRPLEPEQQKKATKSKRKQSKRSG